jgi:diaminopropionate ammonia-lyase
MLLNTRPLHNQPLIDADANALSGKSPDDVIRHLDLSPEQMTPLRSFPALASASAVASIHVKDESHRLGLGSFKALGGAYAVARLAIEHAQATLNRALTPEDLQEPEVQTEVAGLTFCCATDGNHGRSVAWGAAKIGAQSVIFIHEGVSEGRAQVIASFGARIVRAAGTYDDSVAAAAKAAEDNGWTLLSDTSWPGYERIPRLVMQGYTVMLREALQQLPAPPTHVFVQAGVGGLAAAVSGHLALACSPPRPFIIVVEPDRAACILEVARTGALTRIAHGPPTVMAMLECYEPSMVAWRILERTADAFMTIRDEQAVEAMRWLAEPPSGDPAIVAGESGGAGVAAFLDVAADAAMRERVGLDATSRVLLINTEGATDPDLYRQLVGAEPASVEARASW